MLEARARTPEAAAVADGLDRLFEESREALVTLWAGLDTAERDGQAVTAGGEHVALAVHRDDQFGIAGVLLDLASQAPDEHRRWCDRPDPMSGG